MGSPNNQDSGKNSITPPVLSELRKALHAATARSEEFWERQRFAIRERVRVARPRPVYKKGAVWAAAAAVIVIGIVVSLRPKVKPVPDLVSGNDQELLVSIHQLLQMEVPKAFLPGLTLVRELDRAAVKSTKK